MDSEYIDLFKNEQYHPDYLRLNSKGVVPTLIHEGRPVIDSTLIREYLDETFPEPSLVPASPYERSQMRRWSKHIDEGVFEATREISFSAMFREKMRSMTEAERNGRFDNVGDPGRRARFLSTYEEGVEFPYVGQGIFAFEKMFGEMEDDLSSRREWLVGDHFTLATSTLSPSSRDWSSSVFWISGHRGTLCPRMVAAREVAPQFPRRDHGTADTGTSFGHENIRCMDQR